MWFRNYKKKAAAAAPPATIAPAILLAEASPTNWAAVTLLPYGAVTLLPYAAVTLFPYPVPLAYPPVVVAEPAQVGRVMVME